MRTIVSDQSEHASNDNRCLSIPPVWIDNGDQPVCFDKVTIRLRIKPGIECECGRVQIHANTITQGNKTGKGLGKPNRGILWIDGFRRYRTDDESMIIGDNQFFFTFLMFVS